MKSAKPDNDFWREFRALLSEQLDIHYPGWDTVNGDPFDARSSQYSIRRWAGRVADIVVPGPNKYAEFEKHYGKKFDPAVRNQLRELLSKTRQSHREVKHRRKKSIESSERIDQQKDRQRRRLDLHTRLRPEHQEFFGKEQHDLVHLIIGLLKDPFGPRMICVDGLGGSGKTAIAQEVCFKVLDSEQLADIIWISARPSRLTSDLECIPLDHSETMTEIVTDLARAMRREDLFCSPPKTILKELNSLFAQHPYLIVLDNLETASDTENLVEELLPPKEGQTRFLFTSRHILTERPLGGVRRQSVPALSLESSIALVQSELLNLCGFVSLSDHEINTIYEAVGGIPLALKLIAAQAQFLPLVLDDLRRARLGSKWETMFSFIYQRSWDHLDELGKQLFELTVCIPSEGFSYPRLRQEFSHFSDRDFEHALKQLFNHSLLEISGIGTERRYRLHSMTYTFLRTEIFKNLTGMDDM